MRIPINLSSQSPGRKVLAAALIGVIAAALAVAAQYGPGIRVPMAKLNDLLYDSAYHLRPIADQTDGPIVIVAVDEKSLADLARDGIGKKSYGWPWPRQFWGYMLAYFNRCGARAVAMDMIFTEPSVYNDVSGDDGVFAARTDKSKIPIIFGATIDYAGKPGPFAPPVKHPVFGAVNVGDDVVYRLYRPVVHGVPSLASQTAAKVGAAPFDRPFLLHYYGPHETAMGKRTFRYLSASHVLAASIGKKNTGIEPAMFKGKIVLIGAITVGTYDLKSSPVSSQYPGVEVQATALQNMLLGQQVRTVAAPWAAMATALLGALGVAIPRRAGLKLVLAGVVLALLIASGVELFLRGQILWLPLAAPLLALLLATVGAFAWSHLVEGRQRRFVLKALSQYVSPQVAAEIDRDPAALRLGGQRREMTVMFTDIQGFTDLSERLDEQALTNLLNYYLDEMSTLIDIP